MSKDSSPEKRAVYSWDTCVLIAHLTNELDKPLEDIRAVAKDVDTDRADLVLSVTTLIEFEDLIDNERLSADFNGFLSRPNVLLVDVNVPVAKKTREVRMAARASTPTRSIKIPDAQIIATAILYGADVLHTFDTKLLNVSMSPIVDSLPIRVPCLLSGQKVLGFSRQPSSKGCPCHFRRDVPSFGRVLSAIEKGAQSRVLSEYSR